MLQLVDQIGWGVRSGGKYKEFFQMLSICNTSAHFSVINGIRMANLANSAESENNKQGIITSSNITLKVALTSISCKYPCKKSNRWMSMGWRIHFARLESWVELHSAHAAPALGKHLHVNDGLLQAFTLKLEPVRQTCSLPVSCSRQSNQLRAGKLHISPVARPAAPMDDGRVGATPCVCLISYLTP